VTDEQPARTRTYSWPDPQAIAEAAPATTGLAFLERIVAGDVPQPPIGATLDFALVAVDSGSATLVAHPAEYGYNAIGTVHGGVIATWADTSIGYAIQTRLPEGRSITTLDLQVRYLRAVTVDTGPVTITATAEHVGRRTGTARAEIRDAAGRILATATSTCLVVEPPA
jgi:uncharacterized protein (TIGR00369 family)